MFQGSRRIAQGDSGQRCIHQNEHVLRINRDGISEEPSALLPLVFATGNRGQGVGSIEVVWIRLPERGKDRPRCFVISLYPIMIKARRDLGLDQIRGQLRGHLESVPSGLQAFFRSVSEINRKSFLASKITPRGTK